MSYIKDYVDDKIQVNSDYDYSLNNLFIAKSLRELSPLFYKSFKGNFNKSVLDQIPLFQEKDPFVKIYNKTSTNECEYIFTNSSSYVVFIIYPNKEVKYFTVQGFDEDLLKRFELWTEHFIVGKPKSISTYHILQQTKEGVSTVEVEVTNSSLIEENYTPDVIVKYKLLLEDLKSENPSGRLGILQGEPGTGKTFLIKALASECKNIPILLISRSFISENNTPELVSQIFNIREDGLPIIIIIEDADDCLLPRQSDNMHSVHSILNLTDGIMGAALDIRIVCTTNAKKVEIDKAILRPGRLSQRIEVDGLPFDQATKVLQRLTGNLTSEFSQKKSVLTLAEVYKYAKEYS